MKTFISNGCVLVLEKPMNTPHKFYEFQTLFMEHYLNIFGFVKYTLATQF